ncbi:MAG: hypothetical protein K940chlam9_00665, partial [Chlamydiae bacterium]|nr:hypothetical protein [Chlamydiota bacterium]
FVSFVAFRSRYFPVGGMREPGMLVSEDQSLEFLTDLGYTQIVFRCVGAELIGSRLVHKRYSLLSCVVMFGAFFNF